MKKEPIKSGILTREQAAEFLSVSLPTLRRWTVNNILPCYQLGGRVYYKEQDIYKALRPVETFNLSDNGTR